MAGLALPALNTAIVGSRVFFHDTVTSTNALALAETRDGVVFVAETQTAGRGRHGNRWHSPPGLGLWFSVALAGPPRGLMFAGALAVRDAVRPRAELELNWPNDLIYRERKVCGVLVEHREGRSALGIGINVRQQPEDFPEELQGSAGSLADLTGLCWDRGRLLARVLEELDGAVVALRRGGYEGIRDAWVRACDIVGRTVCR